MRRSIIVIALAGPLIILSSSAFAQANPGGGGGDECDKSLHPDRPNCLGYNPYYVPPGASAPLGYPRGPFGSQQYYDSLAVLRRTARGR